MGGSGGSTYTRSWSEPEQKKIDQAREKERIRLDKNINDILNDILVKFNNRDIDWTNDKLDDLLDILGESNEIEKILLGGSVAKHTHVNGISDVDALIILDKSEYKTKSPKELIDMFRRDLKIKLDSSDVEDVLKGKLAVTIQYKDDKGEIQLLPALRSGKKILIPSSDSKSWNEINPAIFQQALSKANKKTDFNLIPTIKLFKSINDGLPKQKQLTGYHIEALAIHSVKNYTGPNTPKSLLINLIEYSSEKVLNTIKDTTGQSSKVDAYLGRSNSVERKYISQILTSIGRRLVTATNVSQWRTLFED